MPTDPAIRFGSFCLRPAQQLLLEADTPVRIGARALDLLIALVERAGEVVTKDELFARVWPGIAVDEGNLKTQMGLLRKALRDGRAGGRYVVTIPGRGYRFVAPVTSETLERIEPQSFSAEPGSELSSARLTRLLGREDAISDIIGRLNRRRFVTIVGPGGIGKTSVALAVAEHAAPSYAGGICVVDCGPLLGASFVARKLASTLGLRIADDDPTHGLVAFLRNKRMLIVLDCCERVVEAAAVLVENLLKGAAGVDILATSREPLRAEGEGVYRLPPLEIPPVSSELTAADALTYPAVQLFVDRVASSVGQFDLRDSDVPVVADICRKLDGIALAIELAAGRVDVFGLPGVAARLEDRVRLLAHGRRTALPRHQTLGATLDWSYDVLTEPEQAVLRRLAVFAGSFTFAAAHAVTIDESDIATDITEIVASLISKSLLNADVRKATGLYRLLDTTRAYALKKLIENDEFNQTARRHARYLQNELERVNAQAETLSASEWSSTEAARIDEVRAALDWTFSATGELEAGIALTVACLPFWTQYSLNGEWRRYVEQALHAGRSSQGWTDHREMQLLAALGALLIYTKGPGAEADAAWTKALKIAVALDSGDYQVRALWGLWSSQFNSGKLSLSLNTAKKLCALAEKSGDTAAALVGERSVGMSLFYLGDYVNARRSTESMLGKYVRPKDRSHIVRFQFDPRLVSRTLRIKILWGQGFPDQAIREVHSVVDEALAVGHVMSLTLALAQAACPVTLLCRDLTSAERFITLLLRHSAEHGLDLWHAWGMCFAAELLIAQGDVDEGLRKLEDVLDGLNPGSFFIQNASLRVTLADVLGKTGQVSRGLAAIDDALARCERDEERWYMAEFLRIRGELIRQENARNSAKEAEKQFRQSLDWARRQKALSWELRTSISLARLYQDKGQVAQAREALVPVYNRFKEGFQTADLVMAKELISELSERRRRSAARRTK